MADFNADSGERETFAAEPALTPGRRRRARIATGPRAPSTDTAIEAILVAEAKAIKALESRSDAMWKLRKRTAFKIAQRLAYVRKLVGHRKFTNWVKRSFVWSRKTAYNYLNLLKVFGENCETVTHLPIGLSALYLLAEKDTPQEVRDAALRVADQFAAEPELGIVDREFVKGMLIIYWKKQREGIETPPDRHIPSEKILLRLQALLGGIEELVRQSKHQTMASFPITAYDPEFAHAVRSVLLDLVILEFGDNPDNCALLTEKIALAGQLRAQEPFIVQIVNLTEQKKRAQGLEALLVEMGLRVPDPF
jgi:hypothetical protein